MSAGALLGATVAGLDDALASFQTALDIQPTPQTLVNLGITLQLLGRSDESTAAFESAKRLNPNLPEIYSGLGSLHLQQSRWYEAAIEFRHVIRLGSDLVNAHLNLAQCFTPRLRPGSPSPPISQVQLDPNFTAAHSSLVFVMQFGPRDDSPTHA